MPTTQWNIPVATQVEFTRAYYDAVFKEGEVVLRSAMAGEEADIEGFMRGVEETIKPADKHNLMLADWLFRRIDQKYGPQATNEFGQQYNGYYARHMRYWVRPGLLQQKVAEFMEVQIPRDPFDRKGLHMLYLEAHRLLRGERGQKTVPFRLTPDAPVESDFGGDVDRYLQASMAWADRQEQYWAAKVSDLDADREWGFRIRCVLQPMQNHIYGDWDLRPREERARRPKRPTPAQTFVATQETLPALVDNSPLGVARRRWWTLYTQALRMSDADIKANPDIVASIQREVRSLEARFGNAVRSEEEPGVADVERPEQTTDEELIELKEYVDLSIPQRRVLGTGSPLTPTSAPSGKARSKRGTARQAPIRMQPEPVADPQVKVYSMPVEDPRPNSNQNLREAMEGISGLYARLDRSLPLHMDRKTIGDRCQRANVASASSSGIEEAVPLILELWRVLNKTPIDWSAAARIDTVLEQLTREHLAGTK